MAEFAGLEKELQKVYGQQEGSRVFRTVLPGILGDFLKMLAGVPTGTRVQEEYRLEDGKGVIVLTARRTGGSPEIEAVFRP